MRLLWTVEAGLPRPRTNAPLFGPDGRHLATPDLLDPVHGVVGEYDGSAHRDREAHGRDVRRDELYRRLGLEEVVMTAGDLQHPRETVERLRTAYDRAAARTPGPRAWTADPPPWWRSTRTVAARRALPDGDRRRLLGYRAA